MSPILRACLDCGQLSTASRCPTHRAQQTQRHNADPDRAYHRTNEHRQRRTRVLARAAYTCHYCGGWATEVDYKIPLSQGGHRTDTNAVAACKTCNSSKGSTIR